MFENINKCYSKITIEEILFVLVSVIIVEWGCLCIHIYLFSYEKLIFFIMPRIFF
jgi:hypothetical protein